MDVVVYDRTGDISGFRTDTAGERTNAVLETYSFVSQHPNAKYHKVDQLLPRASL